VEWLAAVGSIIVIDLVLSGDNAVVIGMAAQRLPERQRKVAILFGAGAAIVLRIALTAVAALLLTIPLLKFVGGSLLLWIGFKLLKIEEEAAHGAGASDSFRDAIMTIIIADVVMSTDNILGVAAASHGDLGLLLFGLILSMVIMMFGGSAIANMIDRFWWLAYLGSAIIVYTGAEMMLTDPWVDQTYHVPHSLIIVVGLVTAFVITGAAHWIYRRGREEEAALIEAMADPEPTTDKAQ
jgi:YjbE family integral membrane protein